MPKSPSLKRRRILQMIIGVVSGLTATGIGSAQEYEASVTFEDQTTSGDKVTIAEIVTSDPVKWKVHTDDTDYAEGHIEGNKRIENRTIELEKEIENSKSVYFSLYPEGGGNSVAYDDALITVENDTIVGINEIEKDPDAGFNYPYFLYVPPTSTEWDDRTPLLVEPNNSPDTSDDFSYHKDTASNLVEEKFPRQISDELGVPLLVPIFPRPRSDPVDWRHLTQQLDTQTLEISEGPLKRIDKQLLRMIDDAQERLAAESRPVRNEIIMDGFSSSGNFVDRFTILYPHRILSITAGGVNGMVVLPRESAKGYTLDYHVGIANVEELTDISVNLEALEEVNQFYYMGAEDENDTIGYRDCWTNEELEEIALDVYGEDMVEDRFTYCEKVYEEEGLEATFKVYDNAGHTPQPALEDIVEFHRQAIADDNTETTEPTEETTSQKSPTDTTKSKSTSSVSSGQTETETKSTSVPTEQSTSTTVPGFTLSAALTAIGATSFGHMIHNRLSSNQSSDRSE